MKVPISWLKDFVDINVSPEVLADKLVSAGFEVEEIIDSGAKMTGVITGKIESIERHPDAEKLIICQLNMGNDNGLLQIVTGADNVSVGDIVPVATHNSVLPDGKCIKKGKLRGVVSNGMLCSGSELMVTEKDFVGADAYGILLLPNNIGVGVDFMSIMSHDDAVLNVEVTANRPDCNSVIGIAREIAAVTGKKFREPKYTYAVDKTDDIAKYVSVEVKSALCNRYMAAVVKDIVIKPSPAFMQERLQAVGIRPINNIVDITNYVLTELGQPMHSFDYKKIGNQIIVRNAVSDEKITVLDGSDVILDDSMLVICDSTQPIALAGIMGGIHSGIDDNTSTIVFESAKFKRDNIRRVSRKVKLISDSSSRYEKGIDYITQELAINRALQLINELEVGVIVEGIIDKCDQAIEQTVINTTTAKINAILGINITDELIVEKLNLLNIETTAVNGEIVAKVPLYREDVLNTNDLAEEVIRLYGYDNIQSTLLEGGTQTKGGRTKSQNEIVFIKQLLCGMGLYEGVTYSFITPRAFDMLILDDNDYRRSAIKLMNPLGEDLSVMRTTLAHSMISVIASNLSKSVKSGRIFEMAKVYIPEKLPLEKLPKEQSMLVMGIWGNEDFFTVKGLVESLMESLNIDARFDVVKCNYLHTGRSAEIKIGREVIGIIGEVHPEVADNYGIDSKVYIIELNMEKILRKIVEFKSFVAIPKYQASERDIAIIVKEEVTAREILDTIKSSAKILEDVKIFDIYRGKGIDTDSKSVAISMTFRADNRTLKDEEIVEQVNKILKSLEKRLNAKLR